MPPRVEINSEEIPIEIVFQGGGAKLVALLAAAEVIYKLAPELNFRVTRVSGSSAGAIAACILGSGRDPAVFKERILRLAKTYLPQISRNISFPSAFVPIFLGKSLYNADAYSRFIRELFEGYNHLSSLPIRVQIHATDIYNGNSKVFDGSDTDHTLEYSVFCSSALPFIFHTYRSDKHLDGGVINNLPVNELIRRPHNDAGTIIGFSFERKLPYLFRGGIKQYLNALTSSVIDYSVLRSLDELGVNNVCHIKTGIDTLDFVAALDEIDKQPYNDYKAQVESFLIKAVSSARNKLSIDNREVDIFDRVRSLHRVARNSDNIRVIRRVFEARSNSLYYKNKSIPDEVRIIDTISPISEPISAYGMTVTSGDSMVDIKDIRYSVVDSEGVHHEATSIPLPPKETDTGVDYNNIILFFHKPLANNGNEYTISCSFHTNEILYNLIVREENFLDAVCYENIEVSELENLDLVCYIPDSMPNVVMKHLNPKDFPNLVSSKQTWIEGQEMSAAELRQFGLPPLGFKALGWKAVNLKRGMAAGFVALA
ncbi:patatin-like phospholipase family protein [Microvirga sp. P5_D2]